ncbi:MAG: cyclomaltodextrinase C-terminal domain-containing protein [Enterobacterales bacterium]|nr:cyclomaltodextrinase C-terminal domain-containing protein [Enterobacterales bacterium]
MTCLSKRSTVYFRYNARNKIMVVLNKNNHAVLIDPKHYKSMISQKERSVFSREVLTQKTINLNKSILVDAKQALIIEINTSIPIEKIN